MRIDDVSERRAHLFREVISSEDSSFERERREREKKERESSSFSSASFERASFSGIHMKHKCTHVEHKGLLLFQSFIHITKALLMP